MRLRHMMLLLGALYLALTFTVDRPGPATRLTVTVKAPTTSHEVQVSKIQAWLQGGGRSPNEQALKVKLRTLVGL